MKRLLLMSLCTLFFCISAQSQWTTITNGPLWKDTDGNPVEAHGAGFLKYNGKWYMAGEDRSSYNQGVNLYSSTDLQTWTFENKIIKPSAYSNQRFIERAKLLRCPSTGKFIVWCHYESQDYSASEAAVFYSDSIDSDYTFHWGGRPLGIKARDCNVFVDNDGTAYFIATTNENTDLGLFRISEDYLSIVEHTLLFDDQYREAPAIIKVGNTYFMISSGLTGWDANQAQYSYSTSLTSGWSPLTNIGNQIAFDTQAASILTIPGSQQTTYLYVGDRWIDPGLAESKTIIFPISFSGTNIDFEYSRQVDIDYSTGATRVTPRSNIISKSNWSVVSVSSQETSYENGSAANAIDGDPSTHWHTQYTGTTATHPHEIVVDMGAEYALTGFICEPRNDNDITGIIRDYQLYFSTDGTNWGAPTTGGWMLYNTEISFEPVNARYFKLLALSEWSGYDYAAVAEFEMIQNTNNDTVDFTPWSQINNGAWDPSSTTVGVQPGDDVVFGPQATLTGGSWTWHGPNGFIATTREVLIGNIGSSEEGVYTAIYADKYGNTSSLEMTIDLSGSGGSATTSHVQSISTGTQSAGKGDKYGTATVTIQDNLNNPVNGATVTGTFSGSFNETVSGTTNSNGIVTLVTSSTARGGVTVHLCVDNVSHGSLTYDDTQNVITCTGGGSRYNVNASGELSVQEQFSLYPNPTEQGIFHVYIPEGFGNADIYIHDVQGRLVFKQMSSSEGQIKINSNLNSGLYIVSIQTETSTVTRKLTIH